MTFTDFLTFAQNMFISIVNSYNNILGVLNQPIVETIASLSFEGTWFGDAIISLFTSIIGDTTHIQMMFGGGLTILCSITIVKWIIGIIT